MSVIWHASPVPGWLAPRLVFSFYDQAQVEQPAPIKYQMAQRFRQLVQFPLGPDFRHQVARRAHAVWEVRRPWWCTAI